MKKVSKIKRLVSIALIFLFSINNFAAIVSDNDGSVFVTKAEFEAMKNNFNSQIESYNDSIDGKIDGAIASYLSGIKITNAETIKIVYSDMKNVKMTGYTYQDEWWEPDIDLAQASTFRGRYTTANSAQQVNWRYCKITYARKESQKVAANLVSAGNESATKPSKVTWVGRASNYCDRINMTKMQAYEGPLTGSSGSVIERSGFMNSPETAATALQYATHIVPGFYKTYTNLQSIWTQSWTWRGTVVDTNQTLVEGVWSGAVELNKWSGDTTSDPHILHWNKYDMYVHDNNWINTLTRLPSRAKRKGTSTTITEDTLLNLAKDTSLAGSSLSGQWYVRECTDTDAVHVSKYYGNTLTGISYSGANGYASTDQPVRVGLLPWKFESDKILQTDITFNTTVGTGTSAKTYTDVEPTLLKGFILGAANKGDRIKWEPKFINRVSTNGTTPTNNFELDVCFCIVGFDEGFNLKTDGEYIKKESGTETYYTTSAGVLSGLTLVMPNDGIIYVKWRPTSTNTTGTTAFAKNWSADLDLMNCDTYTRIKADD